MAGIGFLIGGAIANALAFTGSSYLFSHISKIVSRKKENDTIWLKRNLKNLKLNGVRRDKNG